jgi:hypothetical protein
MHLFPSKFEKLQFTNGPKKKKKIKKKKNKFKKKKKNKFKKKKK